MPRAIALRQEPRGPDGAPEATESPPARAKQKPTGTMIRGQYNRKLKFTLNIGEQRASRPKRQNAPRD